MAEIKTFLAVLSEIPKYIWTACHKLPNKSSKEILYFYQAFMGLMKFDEFQGEVIQLKHHHKNHKERIPRGIHELIDKTLQNLYNHIESRDRQLYSTWKYGTDLNVKKSKTSYDHLRFNLQELFEVYSRFSTQRNQRSSQKSKNSQSQMKICAAEAGLFPINSGPVQQAVSIEEKQLLPYFEKMKAQATKILEVYLKNVDLINHLSHRKSAMYNMMMQDQADTMIEPVKLPQKLIKNIYCQKSTLSHSEVLL